MRYLLICVLSATILLGCKETKQSPANPSEKPASAPKKLIPATPEFFQAALDGHIVTVKKAIEENTDVNSLDTEKRTAIMLAAFNGYINIVEMLIENGADVNKSDLNGRTALMFAASGDNPETVKILIENKAKVNAVDKAENFTPLMYAAAEGKLKVVKILFENGADHKMKDIDGDTAKTFAAQNNHKQVVKLIESYETK